MKKIDMIVKPKDFYTTDNVDKGEILSKAAKHPGRIGERTSKEFFEIHGTNAVYTEEGKL